MALLKMPNLGKNENLSQRSAQNSKRIKKIDQRENLMKKFGSRTVNHLCVIGRR
jgi:hypothetical protein